MYLKNELYLKVTRKLKTYYFNKFHFQEYKQSLKKRIKNNNFTIISNNCFAGSIYQDLGLPYKTPTVGLFFYADCYMKFVNDINSYLNSELRFIENSKYFNGSVEYPIGILKDIEIHFLHYSSEDEAYAKWNKRKLRVNFDNIYFVFSDRDGFDQKHFEIFKNFHSENKVLFTSNRKFDSDYSILLNEFKNEPYIGEITTNKWTYIKEFSIIDFLNSKEGNKFEK